MRESWGAGGFLFPGHQVPGTCRTLSPFGGPALSPPRAQHTPGGEPAAAEAEERGPALAEVLRVRLGAGKRFRAKKMLLLRVSPASPTQVLWTFPCWRPRVSR